MSAPSKPRRKIVWPGRELRSLARAAGLDADQIATAIRAQAGNPKPGDDPAPWNQAFTEMVSAAHPDPEDASAHDANIDRLDDDLHPTGWTQTKDERGVVTTDTPSGAHEDHQVSSPEGDGRSRQRNGSLMLLPIASLRQDGGTQPRASIHVDWIEEYALDMVGGAVFPHVTVFFDGADYWLADGFHRSHAAAVPA